jgi:membrane protease YdiL (CAAX protease family)
VSTDFDPFEPPVPPVSKTPHRVVALLEVLLCSGYPTQLALSGSFMVLGVAPFNKNGGLNTGYVVGISLIDTLFVVGLVLLFLISHGERPRDVIIGRVSIATEAAAGVPLIFVAFAIALVILVATQWLAPWLHTVARNPMQDLLASPREALLFALVVLIAGGVREEVQRAFMLHRFDQWLGGARVGLVVTSIAFGAGHLIQGADAALATGLLGAFWGAIYLRRQSAIAPMVSHAGFDLLQILQFVVARMAQMPT